MIALVTLFVVCAEPLDTFRRRNLAINT